LKEVAMKPNARAQLLDLLKRPDSSSAVEAWSTAVTVDPAAQLEELAELVEQGLVSATEYERQRRKVCDV